MSLLLFDLGGVLVRNVAFERLNALLPVALELDHLKSMWLASPSVRAFELGSSTPEEFARSLVAEFELNCTPNDFIDEFKGWPQGFYPGAIELLATLRKRYRLACLSNSNALHWQRFGGFQQYFDVALLSHLIQAIKPDPACFLAALAHCNVTAAEVLFFDDALANVDAARATGIRAVHVRDFDDLSAQVKHLALLPPNA